MDRFERIAVQIRNLNLEVTLHLMLFALRFSKFADNIYKNHIVPWTSCVNEPKATSRWKRCSSSGTKSDKLDKSVISEKGTPRPTYTSRTRGTSWTSANLSQKGPRLDATKYCMYHHGTGHNTKVCVTLKDKIEELISSPVRLEGSGTGIILEGPNNVTLDQIIKLNFKASNNQVEYKALISRLKLARELASTKKTGHLKTIIQEMLQTPTIDTKDVMAGEEEEPDWMTPYKNFLIQRCCHQTRMKPDT
ncbi:hypothetical protein JHK86_022698 [Glycine max]|nr:hypothetical protein JHK86_022698 [Glycine max]